MLRFLRLPILLTVLLLAAAPSLAQEPPPALTAEEARALSQMLQDDQSRQALVDKLNAVAEAQETDARKAAGAEDQSLPRRVAQFTQNAAESVATLLQRVLRDIQGIATIGEGRAADYAALGQTLMELAIVIAVTVVIFALLNRIYRRARAAACQHPARRADDRGGLGRRLLRCDHRAGNCRRDGH
jgi:hypothetical protein